MKKRGNMIRGTYLFAKLSVENKDSSIHIFSLSIQTLIGLVTLWCSLTYRYIYKPQAPLLIELMNSMLKLELSHLQSNCYRNLVKYCQNLFTSFLTRSCRNQVHSPTELTAVSITSLDPVILCLRLSFHL